MTTTKEQNNTIDRDLLLERIKALFEIAEVLGGPAAVTALENGFLSDKEQPTRPLRQVPIYVTNSRGKRIERTVII